MSQNTLHIVGFGSQASAWAQCLRKSGWTVNVYLPQKSLSSEKALALGFQPEPLNQLAPKLVPGSTHWVALLCPDSKISAVYGDFIASSDADVRIVLAHGYAVYSKELQLNSHHQAVLFAPKAIGPKLLQNFEASFPQAHRLVAAVSSNDVSVLAQGLGFDLKSLVAVSFEDEAVGDLISEQGLLCGGVFTLLQWTLEAMTQAGIPSALIREECCTELELIAGMIRSRGPAQTFQAISHAAQCGTVAISEIMENSELKQRFFEQFEKVKNREFVQYFQSNEWRPNAQKITRRFLDWENQLNFNSQKEGSA